MLFAAGLSYRYLIGTVLVLVPTAAVMIVMSGYRLQRLLSFLDPWKDPLGAGFQLIQSLIAVGSGGMFGKGLMAGVQKLFYIPEPHTDFIYAVIGEELGLIGTTVILICFPRDRVARAAGVARRARSVRRAARARHHDDGRAARRS